MPNKVDYRTFSQRVKNKYPEYINMGDLELAQMWVSQNPQYGEFVVFDQQPVKKKDQVAPSLGAQGGLQYASTGDPIADKAQVQSALKGYSQKKDKSEEIGFWENIGNTIINGSAQMWNGLNQLLYTSSLARAGVQIELATEYGKFARPFKEDYKTKTREQMSLLEESATAFAGSIPVMTASILTGGFAGYGARVAGTLPAFISGFDQSGKEADELGITDPLDRLTFQTLGGTIEGASELIMPDASLIRPLRQRALKEIVRVGAKGFSKADAGRYVAEFSEKVAKEVGEEYAVELGNALRNASFAAAGYDKAAPEMKSARDYAVMTISAAFGAGTFASVGTGVDAAFAKSTAIKKAAENPEAAAQAVADLVDAGKITQEQADAFLAKVASVNKAISKMPDDVDPDVAVNTADLLNEKVGLEEMVKELEENKKRIDPSFHQGVDDRIAQITARINELTQQIAGFQAPTEQIAPEAPQMAPAEVSPEVGMEIPQPQESVLEGPKMPPLEDLEFDNIEFVEPVMTPVETQLVSEKKSPLIKETFQGVTRPRKKPGEVRAPLMEQVTEGGVFKAKLRDSKTGTEFIVEDPELSLDLAIAAQVRESGRTEFPQPAFLETFSEVVDLDPELQTLFPNISETGQPLSLEQRTVSLDGKKVTRNVAQRMQPLYAALEQRMNNAEEIPMSEIEAVVDQIIQLQQEIQNQKGKKTVRAANGVRQEFTPLTDEQKRIFNDFTDALVNKLLSYDFATTTTTGPTTQKTTTAGLIATPREGRPLPEARVQRERLEGAEVTIEGRGRGRIAIKPLPGLGERSVYGITFEETGAEAPETISPTARETGTTPAAVGVEPQTEQDVRQETNAPQEGRGQGEDAAPVPQEEGRQEGQVTPPDVAQEGETPPAAKRTRKTEQQKADEGKAILDKLKETLRSLKAKPGGGANIDLTFGVVPISKAVWNTAIDTAILAIDAGQSIAQAVKAASDYISSKIDGDWGKAKFEQYMDERFGQAPLNQQIDDVAESAGISPKNFRDLYRVNRELFGLNQSEAMSAAIAMDKMIDVMAKRAGVSKTEMYGKLNFKKATEGFAKDLSNRGKLLFQLIGENAELSQEVRNNLQTARVMEAAGESVKSIRLRTGWERGKDGKWRYEIDDSSVSLMFNMKSMSQLGKKYNLDSVLNYPELFSAYPELRKVKISISKKGGSTNEAFFDGKQIVLGIGTYDLSSYIEKLQRQEFLRNVPADILEVVNAYFENEQLFDELRKQGFSFDEALDAKMKKSPFNDEVDKMLLKSGYGETNNLFGREFITPNQKFFEIIRAIEATKKEEDRPSEFNLDLNKDLLLTTLHEIQHWIQKKEGFARGGNMVLAYEQLSAGEKSIYDDLQKKSKEKLDELDSKSLKWYEQGDDIRDIVLAPQNFLNEAYRKIAGEVEARNVEGRFGMTPEQRRATTLQETEDVARDEQMVLFEKAVPQGVKFQVDAWHGSPYQFDKFTTDRIGTGEGAQAFGWGLYFTDLKGIAENYANELSPISTEYLLLGENEQLLRHAVLNNLLNKDVSEVLESYYDRHPILRPLPESEEREIYGEEYDVVIKNRKENIDVFNARKNEKFETGRNLYRVSLHKGKTPDQYTWLEWDKPVGEENAKKILAQLKKDGLLEKAEANWSRKNMGGSFSGKESLENDLKNLRGDHLYERFLSPRVTPVADGLGTSAINRLFGSAKDASLFLLSSGIDGVKYPAESIARGAKSDTARGFNYVVFDENAVSIEEVIKFQKDAVKARGAMMITLDGQATIYALTDPNVSTPLHELAHVFEHYLTDEEKATVQEWAKTEDWTIKTSEAFARGFEKYLAEGKAPTPALQKIFDNFKQWLTDIYRGIVGSDIDIELNKPMRDLYAKMFEFTGEDGPSNFEKWKGDNKLLVGPDIQDAKTGEPIVVRAYHGTTNEFYEFDSSVKGSVEGHLGKINYFTSDYQDAAINYLSEGPDLTSRVERRTDQIESELEGNYDDYYESIPKLSKKYGYTEEELQDDFVSFRSLARDLAKKELYGGTNKVLDVFIKLNNPVVLGKGSTWFQTLNISETDLDQAAQEIADENDISVEEAKQDYDFDIRDRAIENAGYENLAVDALDSALRSNGYRGASASEILGDNLYESDIDLNRLEKELRQNDKAGLFENEEGELASSQVVSDFLKNLGFDGIILTDVSNRFRGMGLGSSTSHIHVFDEFANQIKLADGSNTTFGETRDIRFQLDEGKPQQQAQAETKPTRKAKTVFHSGTLEGKGNIYVSPIREQANEYSSMSGSPVLEFEINENAMAPESEVRDLIGSLGLKLPEGYNLDELFLYEALDTRVKSSLSQGDIDELYTALKDKGYEGIAFRDEDIRGVKREGIDNFIVFDKSSLSEQQAQPEAKPAKTIAEQRKEFRETAKKYFDGLKKMGIAFDPERNSKEDIAFLKALAKYIKLELDAGMVTFKGFIEKTANLVEDFKEASVVKAAKDVWAKEVVKAYPKLYAKYSAAKRKELEKEIKDIRKTMIRRIMDMTDPKIVNLKSQLKTEKRRLSKEAAAQLAAIRNAYDAKTMMAMEPEDLMELMRLTEGIYKEGRSEIKALNESLDEAAQIQGEEMLAAIASKDKRLEKLDSKEAASKMLAKKAGVVVAVKGDDRVIMKEEKDLEALDGEGYTFLFLNTTSDKFVDRSFLDSVVSFFSGKLRTINENARDLRTALELIKSRSKESQDFINGLVAKMNKASVTKARKSEEWSSILKRLRSDLFGPDIKFGYTNWMNAIAKVNGKPLKLINGRGVSIGPINNGKIVSLYRQIMDPTNLVKTDGVRKIDLSDESIQSIIDYMNLPGNLPGKEFALSLTNFFIKVAKDTKVVLENNGYNSTKLDEKRYNKEDFEGDDFIAKVMDQLAETRSEGFIPYTPIQATESPDNSQGVEIKEDDLLDSGDLQKNFSVISNNMITRKPGGVIVPTDIRQTLNAYTAGMANMNAKLPILRETQSVFSKRNLTAMNNAFAPQFTENLKANYISFMTDRVTPVSSSKTTAAIKTWLMTSTAIPMFLNLKSAVLQLVGGPNFMVSYNFSRYIDASKKVFGDKRLFEETLSEIWSLPTIKQRFGGRFSPDSRVISEEMSRYGKVAINIPFTNIRISAKELLSKGYIFSSIGDVLTIAIGAAPIYYDISETNKKKYIADGMSVSEAEEKATQDAEERLFEIIQETQQSSEAMYLSEFQKQSITRIFSSFATATMQYYRKARRAAARMKNKEGDQLQNAYEILHYTAVNAAIFQFFSSMFVDWLSGPGEDELEEMSREERMDFVRYMEDVMATVAQGTGGMGVALQAIILAYKESEKSSKPEKIVESALRTVPAVRMKYDAAVNAIREWKRGDYVRSLAKGAELANIPADRIRSLGLQVSDALTENLEAQERIARLIGFRTESWMREKKQGEIWNGVQSAIDKSTPAERQRAISNTKSAYRDLFQLYGKRYAEATTEAEKARVDSIASKELLNVYNHRQGGPEFTKELQKLFNQSFEFNSLPKDMQKLKNMESNRKIGDIVEEVLSLEKKSEQKAMQYWSSLVNNGIISKNEIERIREEYNTRKGLQ